MGTASGARLLRVRLVRTIAAVVVLTAVGAWGLGMARGGGSTAADDEPSPAPSTSSPVSEPPIADGLRISRTARSPQHRRSASGAPRSDPSHSGSASASPATTPPASPSGTEDGSSAPAPTSEPHENRSDEPEDPMDSMVDEVFDPVTGGPDD